MNVGSWRRKFKAEVENGSWRRKLSSTDYWRRKLRIEAEDKNETWSWKLKSNVLYMYKKNVQEILYLQRNLKINEK